MKGIDRRERRVLCVRYAITGIPTPICKRPHGGYRRLEHGAGQDEIIA